MTISSPAHRSADPHEGRSRRSLISGASFGVGVAAFIDETIFHQLLHWHHFYDGGTPDLALVSDGLFHAVGWFAAVAGLLLLADLRRRNGLWLKRWTAGVLMGIGGFELYDGTVQHKLLRLHQIRYGVDLLPYDVTWNVVAVALLVLGAMLLRRTSQP